MSLLQIPAIHLPNGVDLFRPFPYRPAHFRKALKAFSHRGLLECTPEDHIILNAMPEEDYLSFLLDNGIGTRNIIECPGNGGNFAEDILNNEAVMEAAAHAAGECEGLSFYIHLEEERELAARLGGETTHPALTRAVNRYYFLLRLCEDLAVDLPPSMQLRSGRLKENTAALLQKWGRLFVRGNESIGGSQAYVVENEQDIEDLHRATFRNSRIHRYFVMPYIEEGVSYNVQYTFTADGYRRYGHSRQILHATAHKGNLSDGQPLPDAVADVADRLAERLWETGLRGFSGLDIIHADGKAIPAEINGRKNTSTPALTVYRRLFPQGEGCMKTVPLSVPAGITFGDFAQKAGIENLFSLKERRGLLPFHFASSPVTERLDVAVYAPDAGDLRELEAKLAEI